MGTLADVMAGLAAKVEQRVVEIAVAVHGNLQAATPVDTGFARASWQISVGAPASGEAGGSDFGAASIVSYRLADGSAYVSNNARYIRRLNAGWSKQAAAGFVQHAIAQGVAEVAP